VKGFCVIPPLLRSAQSASSGEGTKLPFKSIHHGVRMTCSSTKPGPGCDEQLVIDSDTRPLLRPRSRWILPSRGSGRGGRSRARRARGLGPSTCRHHQPGDGYQRHGSQNAELHGSSFPARAPTRNRIRAMARDRVLHLRIREARPGTWFKQPQLCRPAGQRSRGLNISAMTHCANEWEGV